MPKFPIHGWVILDKPSGISSAHAVAKVKRILKPLKIGHAGTLDPLASGVLPLALGEATKTVAFMMDSAKSYQFTVSWGDERDTDDCLGKTVATSDARPNASDINAILPEFIGTIEQTPPAYSAIKVDGERAYALARAGETVELKSRQVRVDSLQLLEASPESASFLCHCGKGTYIRSLARDMGRRLGSLGHITVLRRLSVGQFDENQAISLELLENMVHKGDLSFLQPVESALDDILALELDSNQATLLRRGHTIFLPLEEPQGRKLLARHDGTPLAICEALPGAIKPVRVFNL